MEEVVLFLVLNFTSQNNLIIMAASIALKIAVITLVDNMVPEGR